MIDYNEFKNPGAVYRTAPFWALNGLLEEKELKRQINQFHEQGMGGVFLHPRGGMITEYLSEDFWKAIAACLEELKRLGMIGWLYDEDRFPSGTAGGKAIKHNPKNAQTYITQDYEVKQMPISTIFDNESYLDVLNPHAVQDFITITHEEYYRRFKDYFGNTIQAMFTDEPHFQTDKGLPWTHNFEEIFKEKYGYNLADCFNDLFHDSETAAKTRYDYWNLASDLFVSSFSKTMHDWCEEKNIAYTGHYWEHSFPSPKMTGTTMPHYAYMQYPGIDMLFVSDESTPDQYGNDLIVKEVSSVANQLGKERVLTETNGASGWGLDFRYQKRATDWQLALGVNLFCQHLSLYSMEGYRKRDFPLSFSDCQPWWPDYRIMADYIGRMSYAMAQGKYEAKVLVLHPCGSTWVHFDCPDTLERIEVSVKGLVKSLNQRRIMFDLGDEIIMESHGSVADGLLHVGEMAYEILLVPETCVIRKSTLRLLQDFAKAGGKIICTGTAPYLLEGESSEELMQFFDMYAIKEPAPWAILDAMPLPKIKLEEKDGKPLEKVYGHIRNMDTTEMIFLCNLDMYQSHDLRLPVGGLYAVTKLDGETGEDVDISHNGEICFQLPPLQSVLFLIDKSKTVEPVDKPAALLSETIIPLNNWIVELEDHNALNLQFGRASFNGGDYTPIGDVLKIDDNFRSEIGLELGFIFSRQPWMYSPKELATKHDVKVEYTFKVNDLPEGPVMAAIERADMWTVYINDTKAEPLNLHYIDSAFQLHDIKAHIRPGENILRIETVDYTVITTLESAYIVGDFMVKDGSIFKPKKIGLGDITQQGYPYYSGRILYSTEAMFEKEASQALLTIGKWYGITANIIVNGSKIKTIGWPPYEADIKAALVKGKNTISIEIANSMQNLLGPFSADTNQHLVTPGSFYANKHEIFYPMGFDGVGAIAM